MVLLWITSSFPLGARIMGPEGRRHCRRTAASSGRCQWSGQAQGSQKQRTSQRAQRPACGQAAGNQSFVTGSVLAFVRQARPWLWQQPAGSRAVFPPQPLLGVPGVSTASGSWEGQRGCEQPWHRPAECAFVLEGFRKQFAILRMETLSS